MRKTPLILAAALTVVTAGCYRDFDFTSDSKADHVVTDVEGSWVNLDTGAVLGTGTGDDIAVAADWDGNHFFDRGIVTPDGHWVTGSSVGTLVVPPPADLPAYDGHANLTILPVPADYDGDGSADPAWYRESDGGWFIDGAAVPVDFGNGPTALPGTGTGLTENDYDYPVPADYDGDGKDDLSVFNPVTRSWRVKQSSNGATTVQIMGGTGQALPVPADYDGLGHAQRAVYGPWGWYIEGHATADPFGATLDVASTKGIPAVADYDGDGKADLSYVDYDGTWYTNGAESTQTMDFGLGQWPVPAGSNLEVSMPRFFLISFCTLEPTACLPGGG